MTIDRELNDLRARHPGCVLAAFGDLGTKLILRTSSDENFPQEYLDQLCNQAARTFALKDALDGSDDGTVVLTPREVRIIVRSEENASDFLCCVCEDDSVANEIAEAARTVLREAAMGS